MVLGQGSFYRDALPSSTYSFQILVKALVIMYMYQSVNKGRGGEVHYRNNHHSPLFPLSMPLHRVTLQ